MDPALLRQEFDFVIVGTGLSESILAGALSRAGKSVLHLDQNDYYGSNYASLPLEAFLDWTQNKKAEPYIPSEDEFQGPLISDNSQEDPSESSNDDIFIPMTCPPSCTLLSEAFRDDETRQELLSKSSHFSIDLQPRLLLASEDLVQVMITSGVGRYLEFASVDRSYVHMNLSDTGDSIVDNVWQVPCSKKDVFQSKLLSPVEKRMLMKFLQFVADYGETQIQGKDISTENERDLSLGRSLKRPQNKAHKLEIDSERLEEPFQQVLAEEFKLTTKLQDIIVFSVALASFPYAETNAHRMQITARDGLYAVYKYVASIGRFTGAAFLSPLYGVSEVAQSFCRLSAVYGGIYILRAPLQDFKIDTKDHIVRGIQCVDGSMVRTKELVVNGAYLSSLLPEKQVCKQKILRAVYLLDRPIRPDVNRCVLSIPPDDAEIKNPYAIQVVQLDAGACVCRSGDYVIHFEMVEPQEWEDESKKEQVMMKAMEQLLQSQVDDWKTCVQWSAVFSIPQESSATIVGGLEPTDLPSNVHVTELSMEKDGMEPLELHLERATSNAKELFEKLCPGEEFLPKSASAEQAERMEWAEEEGAVLEAAQKLAKEAHVEE